MKWSGADAPVGAPRHVEQPEVLERRVVSSGYLSVQQLQIRLTDGAVVWREVESHGNAAAVLPFDAARHCALVVRQFRAPVFDASGATMLEEACAGMIGRESPERAARREASEELGVTLATLEHVADVWTSPGVSTERQSLFLAPYTRTDLTGEGGGARGEHEGITVVELPLATLARRSEERLIADPKLLLLVLTLRCRRPDLFGTPKCAVRRRPRSRSRPHPTGGIDADTC